MANVELLQYFEPGAWYLTIINDVDESVPMELNANVASKDNLILMNCVNMICFKN